MDSRRLAASPEEALAAFHGEKVSGARFKPPRFPGMPFYYPIMEDDNKHWCLCGNCRKLFPDVPAEQRAGYIHFDWINRIAAKGRELEPELNFITGAYSNSLLYPDPAILKLEPNVAVRLCLAIDSWRDLLPARVLARATTPFSFFC